MKKLLMLIMPLLVISCATAPVGTPGVGSGSNYTPVIDGVKDEAYYRNLRECRQLAYEVQKQQESDAAQSAAVGALLGAALGSLEGSDEALAGAAIGGAVGGGADVASAQSSGKVVISNCMRGRGYNVLL